MGNMAWNKNKQKLNMKAAAGNRLPGSIDLATAIEATSKKQFVKKRNKQRKKKGHVDQAISIAQNSTVSMGKFDKNLSTSQTKQQKEKRRRAR
eukprot:TRINITY_DN2393_c0_g1_i2.p1 TRINITY_DN2393_c0_g1~~TRINITY_DN2393_c0_g1_i2.p1  ORF type:complete len:93 (-),score=30.64 TRINITY_DN2393_c0_g1_i2:200-478(-)